MALDKDYNLIVGLHIREVRESMHLSRKKFSELCDISASFLADVERGKKSPTAKTIYKICTAFNVSADYIVLNYKKEPDRKPGIEILDSFSNEQIEHIIPILHEIQCLASIFPKRI